MSKNRVAHHNKQTPGVSLSHRIAEESQLLAEEKWIIETLKKIKAQKNSLQIERLHLESMRSKLQDSCSVDQKNQESATKPVVNIDKKMPDVPTIMELPITSITDNFNFTNTNNEELCNTEELDLAVTHSVFTREKYGQICDEEEDEEDMENCLLDMDLLMSG